MDTDATGKMEGNSIELTTGQQFEIERFSRTIDATADLEQLRDLAKQLLKAWYSQKAATTWIIREQFTVHNEQ